MIYVAKAGGRCAVSLMRMLARFFCGIDDHWHKCPKCKQAWHHDGNDPRLNAVAAAGLYHRCPRCGRRQTLRVEAKKLTAADYFGGVLHP